MIRVPPKKCQKFYTFFRKFSVNTYMANGKSSFEPPFCDSSEVVTKNLRKTFIMGNPILFETFFILDHSILIIT